MSKAEDYADKVIKANYADEDGIPPHPADRMSGVTFSSMRAWLTQGYEAGAAATRHELVVELQYEIGQALIGMDGAADAARHLHNIRALLSLAE